MLQAERTFDEVTDKLEGAGLLTIAVDGEGLACEGLRQKIADHAAVVQRHAGAVCVEDAHHSHLRMVGR